MNKVIVVYPKPKPDVRRRYRFGGYSHLAKEHRFTNDKCHNCVKVGHVKRVCRAKKAWREKRKGE